MVKNKEIRIPTKTESLYKGNIIVNFYDDKKQHEYEVLHKDKQGFMRKVEGVMSVTQCTGIIDKSGPLMAWAVGLMRDELISQVDRSTYDNPIYITREAILEASKAHHKKKKEAADIGTAVHEWAEAYIKGLNPPMPEHPNVLNGVMAFLQWINDEDVKFISSERLVYSLEHNYVGCMDTEITLGREGHKIVHPGDFKTSKGFYTAYRYQVAGYQGAAEEESNYKLEYGDKILIKFNKETGEFASQMFGHHSRDYDAFINCLGIARREADIKAEEKAIKTALKEYEKEVANNAN